MWRRRDEWGTAADADADAAAWNVLDMDNTGKDKMRTGEEEKGMLFLRMMKLLNSSTVRREDPRGLPLHPHIFLTEKLDFRNGVPPDIRRIL